MPTYRVINKDFIRATTIELTVLDGAGGVHKVRNPGEPERFPPGTLMSDLTPAELSAFANRFEHVSDDPVPEAGAVVAGHAPRLNPELFALVRRSYEGDATQDEQAVVSAIVIFLEHFALQQTTQEETEQLSEALKEFNMPLFVA
jgi:hypothetical protein